MAEICPHCGKYHQDACPRVKSVEYYPDGSIKRVQYHSMVATDWPLVETDMGDWEAWVKESDK